jgi:hypothetical protein
MLLETKEALLTNPLHCLHPLQSATPSPPSSSSGNASWRVEVGSLITLHQKKAKLTMRNYYDRK